MWAKMDLRFNVFKEGRGNGQWGRDRYGRVVGPLVVAHPHMWTDELVKLLTMPRFQFLEHLTLSFFYVDQVFWQDCVHFLQLVSEFAPSVRKLCWM